MEHLDSEYRLLPTPEKSETEIVSSPTAATEVEPAPLLTETSTAKIKTAPLIAEPSTAEVEPALLVAETKIAEVESVPLITAASAADIESTPLVAETSATKIESIPLVAEPSSAEVKLTPLVAETSTAEVEPTPLITEATAPKIESAPLSPKAQFEKLTTALLVAATSPACDSTLEKLLSFMPAYLRDDAKLAFDLYILEKFKVFIREFLENSRRPLKSEHSQNESSSSSLDEQKSATSSGEYQKSESSNTSASAAMDTSFDEKDFATPTALDNVQTSHTNTHVTVDTSLDEKESTTAEIPQEHGEKSYTSTDATTDTSLDEQEPMTPEILKKGENADTTTDTTINTSLGKKGPATPVALENAKNSCTGAEATKALGRKEPLAPNVVLNNAETSLSNADTSMDDSLDGQKSPTPTVLPGTTENLRTGLDATMHTSLADTSQDGSKVMKTTTPNGDRDKGSVSHLPINVTEDASRFDSESANEASQKTNLEDEMADSHDSYIDPAIAEQGSLECADGSDTTNIVNVAMKDENATYVGSDDKTTEPGKLTSTIVGDQNHQSLFSNNTATLSADSPVDQSHFNSSDGSGKTSSSEKRILALHYASYEDPDEFILTRVLQQTCLKVKDYRFDEYSSCMASDGEPFDYVNGKHPDGWDVPDPRGVAEIIRELAMAHDEKGNWKTIEHWDDRPGFMYDHAHYTSVMKYMQDCVDKAFNNPVNFDTSKPLYTSGKGYSSGTDEFLLEPPSHPPTKQADDGWTQVPKNAEQTASKVSEALCEEIEAKREAKKAKRREVMRMRKESTRYARAHRPPPNLYIPRINMYLRPANAKDMQQVSDIYNHYVKNTPNAPDSTVTSREDWVSRFRAIEDDQRLPFLVAICRSKRTSSTHRSRQRYNSLPEENIVGFAFAKQSLGYEGTYNGTVQMQTYVHSGHPHMGIGKNLTDKLIELLDISHTFHNGCDFVKPDDNYIYEAAGGVMRPKQIHINIPFYPGEEDALNWQKEWIWAHFYFDQVATMPGLGERNKKK